MTAHSRHRNRLKQMTVAHALTLPGLVRGCSRAERLAPQWHLSLDSQPHLPSGDLPICRSLLGVSDRTRTGDHLDHNQELYQLSYAHQADLQSSGWRGERKASPLECGISCRRRRNSSLEIVSGLGPGAGLQQAAVDRQGDAGDHASAGGCQPHDGVRNLPRFDQPLDQMHARKGVDIAARPPWLRRPSGRASGFLREDGSCSRYEPADLPRCELHEELLDADLASRQCSGPASGRAGLDEPDGGLTEPVTGVRGRARGATIQ
jgi:hypothetical protein